MTLPEQERERFCQVLYHSRTSLYLSLIHIWCMGLMAKEDYADHAEQVRAEVAELCKRFPLYQE